MELVDAPPLRGRIREAGWERSVTRLGELASQLAQVQAAMVEETVNLLSTDGWAGAGVRSPQHFLQVFAWLSPAHANQLVAVARRRGEIPETVELMGQGRLSLDQASVVARHVPAEFSAGGAELAEKMTVAQLRRTLSRYAFQVTDEVDPDEPAPAAAPVEPDPELSMSSLGRRFKLVFETSLDEGALVEQAIREAKDALFTAGNTHATLADGFMEVVGRSLQAATEARRDHYKVMIHLDVDGKGWLGKKGALPAEVVRRFTCGGKVTPVWEKDGNPVAVGRSQRIVPERTRALVEDRDRGCRYPGCPVTAFLENHHMRHWADGGGTDPENLLSLCPFHHREHHKGEFSITGSPVTADGLVFTSRHGFRIEAVVPWPPPKPPDPTPPNTQILRGDWCDTDWLQIPPNPPAQDRPGPGDVGSEPPQKVDFDPPGSDPPNTEVA